MNNIKSYANFNSNRLIVKKGQYGWDCTFKCDLGTGRAMILDNTSTVKNLPEMKQGEMYLFGIDTQPMNSGIGRKFLTEIFDYFNLDMVYLPSHKEHPVWNKIATKTDMPKGLSEDSVIFTLSREQLKK